MKDTKRGGHNAPNQVVSVENHKSDPDLLRIEIEVDDESLLPADDLRYLTFVRASVNLSNSRHLVIQSKSIELTSGQQVNRYHSLDDWPHHAGRLSTAPARVFNEPFDLDEELPKTRTEIQQEFGKIPASEFTLEHFGITGVAVKSSPVYFWWAVGIGGGASLVLGLWLIYRYRSH